MYSDIPGQSLLSEADFDNAMNIRIVKLASRVGSLVNRDVLAGSELSVQHWRFIITLARFGVGPLTRIAREASLDPAHGSRVAANLEKRGLVRRAGDPVDARRIQVELTPDGIAKFHEIWPKAKKIGDQLRRLYTAEEFAQLKTLLDRSLGEADYLLNQTPGEQS